LEAENYVFEMEIPSDPYQIHRVEENLEKFFRKSGLEETDIENIGIAATEMVNNAIHHGNRDDRKKKVYIKFIKLAHQIEIVIRDDGGGFDPNSIADPLDPENLFKESGRGIFIVKSLMDDVKFKFNQNGTEVTLIKYL